MPRNSFQLTVSTIAKIIVGCLIMMWGVINVVHNFLLWQKQNWEVTHSWPVTAALVLFTGAIPLVFGVWLLLRKQGTQQQARQGTKQPTRAKQSEI